MLVVILFHATVNLIGEIIAITERADAITILLWFVAAAENVHHTRLYYDPIMSAGGHLTQRRAISSPISIPTLMLFSLF